MTPDTTYRPIRQLDETLVNQIAAGEVVERPASAVKELVENSLDAGATQIIVTVTDGGTKEIRVIDNGRGIEPSDLELATRRHATSKIAHESDLEAIETFGFRGEALSSLASVAELEVRSRRPHAELGHQLKIAFGHSFPMTAIGSSPGTTMIVRDLFARLPARQKFLRSPATEFTHIAKVVRELALPNPHVEFSLVHNERPCFKFLIKPLVERFTELIKPEWEPDTIDEEAEFGRMTAFLSPIAETTARGELYLFVNRRPVRNRTLLSAIRNAYLNVLGPEREPSGAVYLDVRFDWVDVNVHPQKWEVRCFQQERLYAWLTASLRKHVGVRLTAAGPQALASSNQNTSPFASPLPGFENEWRRAAPVPGTRYLGKVGATANAAAGWHLAEDETGLILFDPHGLTERNHAVTAVASPETKLVTLPPRLIPVLESQRDRLAELKFDAERFGTADVALKAHPSLVTFAEAPRLLVKVLEHLLSSPAETGPAEAFYRSFFQGEGHGFTLPAGELDPVAAKGLVEGWGPAREGDTCPHGRPFLFRMSWDFVGKQFERGK